MCPAYALREEYTGEADDGVPKFAGGVISTPSGDLDLREALAAGDGTIVVDDDQVVNVLDEVPALKRVKAPTVPTREAGYDNFNLDELRREAKRRGLEGLGSKSKADVIAALEHNDDAGEGA